LNSGAPIFLMNSNETLLAIFVIHEL